ncbi:HD domain-containing phosphohydrolase [Candidatus Magnetaquicoccus inordinatus]|uniref:HD domain-containing phosphohydrolase n=1 Tax=Candidatus Magnetaquicoccus inordinatus TaxID=2496818 RepID=UPI001D0EEC94|nr:HD domain-containing phosphohydrolase [Candidatus Magnetaquicoccus inordinatus]
MANLWRFLWFLLLGGVAITVGFVVDYYTLRDFENEQLAFLRVRAADSAWRIASQTINGQTMGIALVLGLNEPVVKQAALGKLPPDDPAVLERTRSVTRLLKADGTYVVNAQGIVVAHDSTRVSYTGMNLTFRPYWQQAMAGMISVYAAVGANTGERGLFVAAPLRLTDQPNSEVIGAVVVKVLADYLDDELVNMGSRALLLSPQSVVFATSHKDWMYRIGVEPTADRVEEINTLKQFGKVFQKAQPVRLPFDLGQNFATLDGVRYAVLQSTIDWHDPFGLWKLVVLQDTSNWTTLSRRLLIDIPAGIGAALLMVFIRMRRLTHLRELENQAKLAEHANQLESEVANRTKDLRISQDKLKNLVDTGVELGREQNRMALLRKILFGGRDLLHCDAGTLYLVTEHKTLAFTLRTNDDEALPSFEIPLYDPEGKPVERFISTWCALHNKPVVIDDIYQETHFDVSGTKRFDANSGYKTVSMLTVPLAPREGEVIGVLQFLNALHPETDEITTFHPELIGFVTAMATQAAVALDNHKLIESQKALMDALIKLVAGAIDTKSPYTGGHCERVPELGIMLAEAACAVQEGELADFQLHTDDEWREFRIGAWLHDCGKVTTPEYVVDKGCKLETIYNRLHEVRMRFEVLLRDAMNERWRAIANGVEESVANQQYEERRQQLLDDFNFVAECNLGDEFISPDRLARLQRLSEQTWLRHFDDRIGLSHVELQRYQGEAPTLPVLEKLLADKPEHVIPRTDFSVADPKYGFKIKIPDNLYNYGELYNLSIGRGTLTEEERFKINEHVVQTIIMLEQLPLPKELRRVPEYAGSHHETLVGTGYPRKWDKSQLNVPARIMAIADIFEALTASDRPYKKAKKLSEAIKILSFFKKDGHIDPVLFDLFLSSGVYMRYAEKYLLPEQIDEVDVSRYVSAG